MHPFHRVKSEEVKDNESLELYIMQQLGVGYVTKTDRSAFIKSLNRLFSEYERADYKTMLRVVEWAKSRKRRFSRLVQVVEAARYAYEDGYLPELDPGNEDDIDEQIRCILQQEEDERWRRRLLVAQGQTAKESVITMWQEQHKVAS